MKGSAHLVLKQQCDRFELKILKSKGCDDLFVCPDSPSSEKALGW